MDAMAVITHQSKARFIGKSICQKLHKSIPRYLYTNNVLSVAEILTRQLYEVVIQASVNNKIITRETLVTPYSGIYQYL